MTPNPALHILYLSQCVQESAEWPIVQYHPDLQVHLLLLVAEQLWAYTRFVAG